MSVLLYVVGAISVVSGIASIGFGIPVKEFSFGDTLIIAGTVATVGGFIMIALAMAVTQLTRIAEMLGDRPLSKSAMGQAAAALGRSPIPFPPKPKSRDEAPLPPPFPVFEPLKDDRSLDAAPALPNPDVPVMAEAEAEELPLSPVKPPPPRPAAKFPEPPKAPAADSAPKLFDPPPKSFESWRTSPPRPAQSSYFDALLRDENRAPPPPRMPEPPSRAESIPRAPAMIEPVPHDEPEPEPENAKVEESRAVAILKSGVVDGMGYTLYVDGSIEAELPDGTVRFASINELRAHLERGG